MQKMNKVKMVIILMMMMMMKVTMAMKKMIQIVQMKLSLTSKILIFF